jgi:hypothetical protein
VKELQTVALGLVVVFLDVGDPDWVADPIGWLLVLLGIAAAREQLTDYRYLQLTGWVCLALSIVTWPPDSVPTLDDTLSWLFSLPTLAFCFMLADSLIDVTEPGLSQRFRVIAWLYALVTVLPAAPLLLDWEWLGTPTVVLTILAYVVLVISLFSASADDALRDGEEPAPSRSSREREGGARGAADAAKQRTKDAVATVSGNVRTAAEDTSRTVKETARTVKDKATGNGGSDGGAEKGEHQA